MGKKYEICSGILPKTKIDKFLKVLPSFLNEFIREPIYIVKYGWGCNIHNDLHYQPMQVGINWLDRFINESIEQRIYKPGESDLYIETKDNSIVILFCHESDIHIKAIEKERLEKLVKENYLNELFTQEKIRIIEQ